MTAAAELPYESAAGSAAAAPSLRVAVAPAARRRPTLRLVATARSAAPRAPFVAVVVSILVAGLLGLLVLNTALAQDAFAVHTLSKQGRVLADQEQSLSREVEALRSPQALAAQAGELGMVQAGPPAFLRLPDGVILGAAQPAVPPEGAADAAAAPAKPVAPIDVNDDGIAGNDVPVRTKVDVNDDGIAGNDVPVREKPVDVNHDGIAGNDVPERKGAVDVNNDGIAGNDVPVESAR